MVCRPSESLLKSTAGAVAPTVALSLFGLVAAAGIGFDYARLAGMHSELQNAADQAALAAASQLDGKPDATKRAELAAASLVANSTLFANDSKSAKIGVAKVVFYRDKAATQAITRDDSTTADDSLARYVAITVDSRQAFYAFTPIVAAFSSGDIDAQAMAGLGSATCKVPPIMMCNPQETTGDFDFTVANYVGKGLKLVSVGNGGGAWTPGNFGYLETGDTTGGAAGLRKALAWDQISGDCSPSSGVTTKPGANVSVTDAINTRFDIFDAGACPAGGTCSPSANSTKDLVKTDGTGANACTASPSGWQVSNTPYLPSAPMPLAGSYPDAMGYPRDMCHAVSRDGVCPGGRTGDGAWDVDAYFYVNYNHATHSQWVAALSSGLAPVAISGGSAPFGVTRYQVYRWEMTNAGSSINGQQVLGTRQVGTGGNPLRAHGGAYCRPPGIMPGARTPDRRRLTMAVVNCSANGVKGNSTDVPVQKWIDVFLVEPSVNRARTSLGDVYVEVIREAASGPDETAAQIVRRETPFLVR